MLRDKWTLHMLQIFADGGAAAGGGEGGGGEGTATGTNAADAGPQRLLDLGVPKDKLTRPRKNERRPPFAAAKAAEPPKSGTAGQAEAQSKPEPAQPETKETGAQQNPAAEPAADKPAPLDWDALLKNPDFNNRLQYMMRQRLGEEGSAKAKLEALGPVLQKLAKGQGIELDVSNMMTLDTDSLQSLVQHDRKYIQDRAAELGTDEETAQQFVALEDYKAAKQDQERKAQLREAFNKHVSGLRAQGEAMKEKFPDFDFDREMQNERFVHMTSPTGGMSVKEAYYALHNEEILQQQTAEAARKSKEQLTAAVQANQARPRENGAGGQRAAVPHFNYAALSRKDQEAFKEEIRQAAYRGEKIYPR